MLLFFGSAGGGVWETGAGQRRAKRSGRGAGSGGQNWGASLRGGAGSTERRANAATVHGAKLKVEHRLGSRVQSGESAAEACFLQASEIATHQQAKSLELRAVMSLARLWQSQGKHPQARNTLSEISLGQNIHAASR